MVKLNRVPEQYWVCRNMFCERYLMVTEVQVEDPAIRCTVCRSNRPELVDTYRLDDDGCLRADRPEAPEVAKP